MSLGGVFALENFEPQDFLLEYRGCRQKDTGCPRNEHFCQEDKCRNLTDHLHNLYSRHGDPNISGGGYIFEYKHNDQPHLIDATVQCAESLGRFVNDAAEQFANCKTV